MPTFVIWHKYFVNLVPGKIDRDNEFSSGILLNESFAGRDTPDPNSDSYGRWHTAYSSKYTGLVQTIVHEDVSQAI